MAAVVGSIDCARFQLQPWPGHARLSSCRPFTRALWPSFVRQPFEIIKIVLAGGIIKSREGRRGGGEGGGALAGISPVTACVVQYARGRGRGWRGGGGGGVAGDCLRARSRSNTALHGLETHHDNPGRGL